MTSADLITPTLTSRSVSADRLPARDASRRSLPAAAAPVFLPAHQGHNPFAFGQNVLFTDGRAIFVATATWQPDGNFGQSAESSVSP